MEKIVLIVMMCSMLFARQIVLVVAEDFNSTTGRLSCLEDGKVVCRDIFVNLGRSGLGWGLGIVDIAHDKNEPVKKEGDGRAPAGVFPLTKLFGYATQPKDLKMPYLQATDDLVCVDDSTSPNYNRLVYGDKTAKSFEKMYREDGLYRFGVVVGHNQKALKGRGSCIFLHIERFRGAPTAGCTSMSKKNLQSIVHWLDMSKTPILIQLPKKYASSVSEFLYNYTTKREDGRIMHNE